MNEQKLILLLETIFRRIDERSLPEVYLNHPKIRNARENRSKLSVGEWIFFLIEYLCTH